MSRHGGRTQDKLYEANRTYWGQFSRQQSPRGDVQRETDDRRLGKALLSGLAGGLAATWVMTQYQVNSQKVIGKLQSRGNRQAEEEAAPSEPQPREEPESSTVKMAGLIARKVAGKELPQGRKQLAGNLVHYAFGTLVGGVYGVLREVWPTSSAAHGVPYGAAVWAGVDEIALPAIGLAKWAPEYPFQVHANALGAHLVYALTLDGASRGVRHLLNQGSGKAELQELDPRSKEWEETKTELRPSRMHPRAANPASSGPERKRTRRTAA